MILVSTNDGCFKGRRVVGKPRGRRESAVWKNAVYLLQIRNCKAAVTMREVWGEGDREGHDRQQEVLQRTKKKEKYSFE